MFILLLLIDIVFVFFGAVLVFLSRFLFVSIPSSLLLCISSPYVSVCCHMFAFIFSHTLFEISFELIFGCRYTSMAEARFTLYLVVEKGQRNAFDSIGTVPISIVNPRGHYIGLRELRCEAVKRARYYAKSGDVTPESHMLLKIQFSAAGFMHYTTTSAGRDHSYSPLLYKNVYSKNECDWKVWHLLQDLPLRWEASPGAMYVSTEWLEIDF